MRDAFVIAGAFALGLAGTASAKVESAYTDLNEKTCKTVDSAAPGEGEWVVQSCKGWKGETVWLSEDDLRVTVSYGRAGRDEMAWGQGFPFFNNVGKGKLEWRVRDGKAVATILRWTMAHPDGDGRNADVLVVTQLGAGQTCHVAYVDAGANKNANALARAEADKAGAIDCGAGPKIVGDKTDWVELPAAQ